MLQYWLVACYISLEWLDRDLWQLPLLWWVIFQTTANSLNSFGVNCGVLSLKTGSWGTWWQYLFGNQATGLVQNNLTSNMQWWTLLSCQRWGGLLLLETMGVGVHHGVSEVLSVGLSGRGGRMILGLEWDKQRDTISIWVHLYQSSSLDSSREGRWKACPSQDCMEVQFKENALVGRRDWMHDWPCENSQC